MSKTLEAGVKAPVGPRTIEASRLQISLYLLGSLVFVVIGLVVIQNPSPRIGAWFAVLFFGLCAAVFATLLLRPQVLILDAGGFTVGGGLIRSPRKVLWRDVEGFFVYRLPKGGKTIGYNLAPAARKDTPLTRIASSLGADGALPRGWPGSPEKMVEDLNAYRLWALNQRPG
jgi:hypothetical protein